MIKKPFLPLHLQLFAETEPPVDSPKTETDPVDPKEPADQEKTYTQDELEKIVKQRVAREKKAAEEAVKEAEKLAKMNADEKEKYEREKLEAELAEYKKKDAFYGLSKEASKMLSENGIQADDELLAFVVKEDAEATKTAVNAFVKLVDAKVSEGVKQALSGTPPRKYASNQQALTKEKIMAIKDSTERIKAIQDNPQLFN